MSGYAKAKKKLLVVTTVPETLSTILKGQPAFLARHFDLRLATSLGDEVILITSNEGLELSIVPMVRGISPVRDLLSVMRMIVLLRQMRPDAVHSYTPKAGLVTMIAAWLCRVPVRIHTFTGLIFPTASGAKQKLLIWIDRLICACATRVVPEGQGVAQDLRRFGITHKPLQVIGSGNIAGVDTAYFNPADTHSVERAQTLRSALGIADSAFVFCFVGRLNRDKGLLELVRAFEQLDGGQLLLVGAHDQTAPLDARTRQVLDEHPRIHHVGFQEDIRAALLSADVLVLPSYREGFPNVLLQAGSMSLPVIASDINGCNEIVTPSLNGWLVPARDSEALRLAMQVAMETSEEGLIAMGQEARLNVKACFEQEAHWQRMVEFYQGELSREASV
ncbi:glycosyltransferase family 4 protein [Pseudomonas sp. PDM14]|uniref:glycosyltransferase family 4 protein n=1 Tax=Pseudomonas sp. PDM14 TaxID=2769288 RepID=UPI00177ACD8C|nr:glycosyltransferase family 4 protein [Pseudomonas sp. PDM14]MBD9484615.1 glycosyltransferase family 4 protein [Pseudomonas sp. PDM14]